jgi:hypothetical protein
VLPTFCHARGPQRSVRRCPAAQPDGEAVTGVHERDVGIELMLDPEPKARVCGAMCCGNKACQGVYGAGAGVMDGCHDAVLTADS